MVVTTNAMPEDHATQLQVHGVEVLRLPCSANSSQPDIKVLLEALGNRHIQSLLVEGGHTVLGSFFDCAAVNEVWAFLAPMLIGGNNAMPSIGGLGIDELNKAAMLRDISVESLNTDLLIKGRVEYLDSVMTNESNTGHVKAGRSEPIFISQANTDRLNEDKYNPLNKSEAS